MTEHFRQGGDILNDIYLVLLEQFSVSIFICSNR